MDIPIEALCSLGVGGVFGLVVFLIYRKDRKSSEDQLRQDRIFMEDRMEKIIERDQDTREANTTALVSLNKTLDRMNGRH